MMKWVRMIDRKPKEIALSELSITQLAKMLCSARDVDEALLFENEITRKIDNSNVTDIELLIQSKDRYCVVAALRILSDSGRAGISAVYGSIDRIFDRHDLILNRLCISLIVQHSVYGAQSNMRLMEFVDSDDEQIRRDIRIWFMSRRKEELVEFASACSGKTFGTRHLIDLVILFKLRRLSMEQFLERANGIDETAFHAYRSMSKLRTRYAKSLFQYW